MRQLIIFNIIACESSSGGFIPLKHCVTYQVTYDANSGTGNVPVDDTAYHEGDTVTVLGAGTLTKAGYVFAGWNTQADGSGTTYNEGDVFLMGKENITLYAKWEKRVSNILVVAYDTGAANAMISSLEANGHTCVTKTRDEFEAMAVDELLVYDAVFYAGGYSGDSWAKVMAYLDAGGRFFIADNDLGYGNRDTTFYQTYLQAAYVSDGGSDGILTGKDIMAGINPDISSDPYPDDFTVREEGVEIFQAPSGKSAGVLVNRNGYKAVYLAWDFPYTPADSRGAIIAIIVDYLGS